MNSIYIRHDGRYRSRVLLSTIPTSECNLDVKVTDLEFSYKSQNIWLYHQDLLMNFIYIWHDGRYRFEVLLREIRGKTLRSRSQT